MHCLLPLITSLSFLFFYSYLLPSSPCSRISRFWPLYLYVSPALWCISITSSPIFFPLPLHCISLSALLFSCPTIPLLFLFFHSPLPTLHNPPSSSLFTCSSLFWQSKLVSSICCVAFYGPAPSQPQQPCDNGHHTQPNSGLKEIYRAIMWRLPHWRFTTAKSTGLNTPSKSATWLPSL